jgi:hypothetical protein
MLAWHNESDGGRAMATTLLRGVPGQWREKKESIMSKWLKLLAIPVLVVGLNASLALAEEKNSDVDTVSSETVTAEGVVTFTFQATTVNSVFSLLCTAHDGPICVETADDQAFGDVWAATLSRTNGTQVNRASNQSPAGVALPVGVFSLPRCSNSTKVLIHASPGNEIPAGLPAKFFLRVTSPPFAGLSCSVKSINLTF